MPGVVTALSGITDVYPFTTFVGFTAVLTAPTAIISYPDGSSQRRAKATDPRRAWNVSHRLSASGAVTMRAFYKAHLVALFKFKDVSNGLTYHAVFTGPYKEERVLSGRFNITLQLQEAA
jgi:hypothetical protein